MVYSISTFLEPCYHKVPFFSLQALCLAECDYGKRVPGQRTRTIRLVFQCEHSGKDGLEEGVLEKGLKEHMTRIQVRQCLEGQQGIHQSSNEKNRSSNKII